MLYPTTLEKFFLPSISRLTMSWLQEPTSPSRQLFSFFHCRLLSLHSGGIACSSELADQFSFFVSFHYNVLQLTFLPFARKIQSISLPSLSGVRQKLSLSFIYIEYICFFICLWKRNSQKTKLLLEWSFAKTMRFCIKKYK